VTLRHRLFAPPFSAPPLEQTKSRHPTSALEDHRNEDVEFKGSRPGDRSENSSTLRKLHQNACFTSTVIYEYILLSNTLYQLSTISIMCFLFFIFRRRQKPSQSPSSRDADYQRRSSSVSADSIPYPSREQGVTGYSTPPSTASESL
jgi:hypothetical protein